MTEGQEKPKGKPTTEYISEFMRMTLVQIHDLIALGKGSEEFKAGAALVIEEVSARMIGEFFDAYHERIHKVIHEAQVTTLASEFEEALNQQVAAGECDLVIGADGERRYATRARKDGQGNG